MTKFTITALGQVVTYNPKAVLAKLRSQYKTVCCTESDVQRQNSTLVNRLYANLGHKLMPGEAEGILICFGQGAHVSNVILRAAGLVK